MTERGSVTAEICPDCGRVMTARRSVYNVRKDGVPVSRYVCKECARRWSQRQDEMRKEAA